MSPAARGWCVIVGGSLGYDVWLVANGHEPLTAEARKPHGWLVTGIVLTHFAGVLPRWLDPFTSVGWAAEQVVRWSGPNGRVLP